MFFNVFASYTWRMVLILCQIDQLTFPTDSENMNLIRALFLVENHGFRFPGISLLLFTLAHTREIPDFFDFHQNPTRDCEKIGPKTKVWRLKIRKAC